MPPIPVHIDEPITPSKAKGITPRTAQDDLTTTTTTTSAAAGGPPPAYPKAQPAAAPAVPGPTPFAHPTPTRTEQPSQDAVPPPPQPGAVPAPPTQTSDIPPPPRAGQGTAFTSALNSMHPAPPQSNLAPTHSTEPVTPSRQPQQTTVNLGPVNPPPSVSAAHPTGYQQNLFAQEMSPAQRASLDQQEAEERRGSIFAGLPGGANGGGSGSGGGGVIGEDASQTAGNMWNAVKGWASAAGAKVGDVHNEAWKRIDGKK